jgi:hypothetical protein
MSSSCFFFWSKKIILIENLGCLGANVKQITILVDTLMKANVEQIGVETDDLAKVRVVKQKMETFGIKCGDFVMPGRYHQLFCPKVSPLLYNSVNTLLHIYIILLAHCMFLYCI